MTTGPLVLAVDDESGILRLIQLELTTQGFRVVTAEDLVPAGRASRRGARR